MRTTPGRRPDPVRHETSEWEVTRQLTTQVIVLDGGSSSGKSGIARCLQAILPGPWIRLGVDDLLERLPP